MKKQNNNLSNNEIVFAQKKNKFIWPLVFIIIATISILTIISQSKNFSFYTFISYLKSISPIWIILAIISMFANIIIEGIALSSICKSFGCKVKKGHGFFYSASDIYFSAITPSATGGQPACAYFMMKDKIPGVIVTISLLLNLMMYTFSIVILSIISFLICPKIFLSFSFLSKALIFMGILFQLILVLLFYLLLYKDYFLEHILKKVVKLGGRLHLIRDVNEKTEKIIKKMHDYRESIAILKEKPRLLLTNLCLNILQRLAQILVIVFVFLATGGKINQIISVIVIQVFTLSGSYVVPIPGAIGVTDYLMLDGFKKIMHIENVTNFELLSRALSFYSCILICGFATIIKYFLWKRSEKNDRIL